MRKILSVFLTLCLVTIVIGENNVVAAESILNDTKCEIIDETYDLSGNCTKQVSKMGNDLLYYENNGETILSSIIYENGTIEISYSNIKSPDIITTSIYEPMNSRKVLQEEFNLTINRLIEIAHNEAAQTWETNKSDFIVEKDLAIRSSSNIFDEVTSAFGAEYSNKFLGSKYKNGVTAKLYENYDHNITNYNDWLLSAGLLLTLASVIVGFPASVIAGCIAVSSGALGLYYIINDILAEAYNVNLNYMKLVKISNEYPYNAGKTIKYKGLVGDIGCAFDYKSTTKHFDFDDNNLLLETGINNYLMYN